MALGKKDSEKAVRSSVGARGANEGVKQRMDQAEKRVHCQGVWFWCEHPIDEKLRVNPCEIVPLANPERHRGGGQSLLHARQAVLARALPSLQRPKSASSPVFNVRV